MTELLSNLFGVYLVVSIIAAICFVVWSILYGLATYFEGGRNKSEARFLLKLWACVPGSFVWPVAVPALMFISHKGLLSEAGFESYRERRERIRRETEVAKDRERRALQARTEQLEDILRLNEIWYPPDYHGNRAFDPARRSA